MYSIQITLVLGARPAIRAAAALPALFSSMKLMVELMINNDNMPTKSCQSGGLPWNHLLMMRKLRQKNTKHKSANILKFAGQ